jgi:hypothetical protein
MTPDDEPRSQYAALIWTTRLSPRTIVRSLSISLAARDAVRIATSLSSLRAYRTPFRCVRIDSLLLMK